jgi:hypothetical protein
MDIFQRNKSLSEREERHLYGTSFNRGDLNGHDGDLLLPQNYGAPPMIPLLYTPKSLSFPPSMQKNFVNIPVTKLKPRKSSRAWSSSMVSDLKENRSLCIPMNLDCHTESAYFTIKAVSNTQSELILSEPPLKKPKIALEPRPFKLQPRRAHYLLPRPPRQSHQATGEDTTTDSVLRAQHYPGAFLPFKNNIPRLIEAPPKHGHEDTLHADGRSCFLFEKEEVDGLQTPQKTHSSPKNSVAEPTLWETARSVLSFHKPHATRGHDATPCRRQVDASSMNKNHHKECNTVIWQSSYSAFGTTMRDVIH